MRLRYGLLTELVCGGPELGEDQPDEHPSGSFYE